VLEHLVDGVADEVEHRVQAVALAEDPRNFMVGSGALRCSASAGRISWARRGSWPAVILYELLGALARTIQGASLSF